VDSSFFDDAGDAAALSVFHYAFHDVFWKIAHHKFLTIRKSQYGVGCRFDETNEIGIDQDGTAIDFTELDHLCWLAADSPLVRS
jgi:hypothetical protein